MEIVPGGFLPSHFGSKSILEINEKAPPFLSMNNAPPKECEQFSRILSIDSSVLHQEASLEGNIEKGEEEGAGMHSLTLENSIKNENELSSTEIPMSEPKIPRNVNVSKHHFE